MIRPTLFALGVMVAAGPAAAQDMPRYDVAAYCDQIAAFGGAPSAVIRNGCVQQEQAAYDALKAKWAALPANMQKHCNQVATAVGMGSYAILKGCVDMENSAASRPPAFKY